MGISLILGGSEPLPGWFGALMQWKLKLKWAFACVKEGVKACQDALCTYVPSKRWFGKFAQIGPGKMCPRVPVWVRGGGCNRYLGNAQIECALTDTGASLTQSSLKDVCKYFSLIFNRFVTKLLLLTKATLLQWWWSVDDGEPCNENGGDENYQCDMVGLSISLCFFLDFPEKFSVIFWIFTFLHTVGESHLSSGWIYIFFLMKAWNIETILRWSPIGFVSNINLQFSWDQRRWGASYWRGHTSLSARQSFFPLKR